MSIRISTMRFITKHIIVKMLKDKEEKTSRKNRLNIKTQRNNNKTID